MVRRIASFELGLGEEWLGVPEGLDDLDEWARATADELVSRSSHRVQAMQEDASQLLAEQLVAVGEAVRRSEIGALSTAALVRNPELGVVDAMLTVALQADFSREQFTADLDESVREADPPYLSVGSFDGVVDAGVVVGLHTMLADQSEAEEFDVPLVEERVVLGVFPHESCDMVEVTALARGLGTFEDMPQAIVDAAAGLVVELEEA